MSCAIIKPQSSEYAHTNRPAVLVSLPTYGLIATDAPNGSNETNGTNGTNGSNGTNGTHAASALKVYTERLQQTKALLKLYQEQQQAAHIGSSSSQIFTDIHDARAMLQCFADKIEKTKRQIARCETQLKAAHLKAAQLKATHVAAAADFVVGQ